MPYFTPPYSDETIASSAKKKRRQEPRETKWGEREFDQLSHDFYVARDPSFDTGLFQLDSFYVTLLCLSVIAAILFLPLPCKKKNIPRDIGSKGFEN